MFSVYIAARSLQGDEWATFLKNRPHDAVVAGVTNSLTTAIAECAEKTPGALLLDDGLLLESPEYMDALVQAPYPIVLIIAPNDGAAAHRAIQLKANDLLTWDNWPTELLLSLEKTALPLYPRDKKLGHVIGVFSPKGGVGKTTLAVNLSVALAQKQHEPVALVDLDLAFGDVAAMLALSPKQTIHDVVLADVDPATLKRAMITPHPNLSVLAAPATPEQAEDIIPSALVKIVDSLREDHAFVVIDLAPGYQDTNVIGLDLCDIVLTICTPDVVTLRTVGQALALFRDDFHYPADKVRLVLNRTGSHTGIERNDVSAILKTPHLYELPSGGSQPVRAANHGVPFVIQEPNSVLGRAITSLAAKLAEKSGNNESGRWLRRTSRTRRAHE